MDARLLHLERQWQQRPKSFYSMKTLEAEKVNTKKAAINTGIDQKDRREIARGLYKVLADSYCLMLMTQDCHWNVRGIHFINIHKLTEEQYRELFEAVDVIAERIRALGEPVAGNFKAFQEVSSMPVPGAALREEEMLGVLLRGHEDIAKNARAQVGLAASAKDDATVDLLTNRMKHHEKTAWMLRSMLGLG